MCSRKNKREVVFAHQHCLQSCRCIIIAVLQFFFRFG